MNVYNRQHITTCIYALYDDDNVQYINKYNSFHLYI